MKLPRDAAGARTVSPSMLMGVVIRSFERSFASPLAYSLGVADLAWHNFDSFGQLGLVDFAGFYFSRRSTR